MPGTRSLLGDYEDDGGEVQKLTVNRDYASRFQHNKEREDLHRLKDKQKRGLIPMDDDESSSEEEDEGEIEPETEVKILDVIKRIRSKDPAIYKEGTAFFGDGGDDDDEEEKPARKAKKERPMYLKDVIAKQAMEEAAEREDGDSSGDSDAGAKEPTYVEEQAALRQAFLEAADSDEEVEGGEGGGIGGGLVRRKGRAVPTGDGGELEELAGAVFGKDEETMKDDDRFLKNFILNKGWVDEDEEGLPGRRAMPDLESDEEDVENAETFENKYNYRFEEEGSARIVTHAREIEGTIRKKDERRKKGREAKKARQEAKKDEADLDLKRLKNIKKKDLNKKIQKMQALAGKGASKEEALLMELLEKDFDPEEYDKQMAAAFGDDYYHRGMGAAAEDEAAVLDAAVQKELAEMSYADSDEGGEGLAKVRESLGHGSGTAEWEMGEGNEDTADVGGEVGEGDQAEGKDVKDQRKEVLQALDEYYKLDYEQDIGGLKCRFNYRQVDSEDFGLQPDDILTMNDKQLNELVGIRMLAPYREDQYKHKKLRYKVLDAMGKVRQERREKEAARDRRKEAKKKQRQEQRQQDKQEKQAKPAEAPGDSQPKPRKRKILAKEKKPRSSPAKPAGKESQEEAKPVRSGDKALADRKASYALPKLNKGPTAGTHDSKASSKSKKRKADGGQGGGDSSNDTPGPKAGLSKAQKKNARRAEIRAAKKPKPE